MELKYKLHAAGIHVVSFMPHEWTGKVHKKLLLSISMSTNNKVTFFLRFAFLFVRSDIIMFRMHST